MTDNRTTELLRKLLDERGVEHYDGTESTLWLRDEHGYRASADELSSGRLSVHIWCDTPEQAIAATLGNETCKYDETEIIPVIRIFANAYANDPLGDRIHVLECTVCGGTYEHVNGDYEYCPRCGRRCEGEDA